jgi:hypothetical protein
MPQLALDRSGVAARLVLGVALASLSGCVSIRAGTGLDDPHPARATIGSRAWVHRVAIQDPEADASEKTEDALTLNLEKFLSDGRYFEDVALAPGRMAEDDVALRFTFSRYRQTRSVHPAYFPGALLTLTLYIWFGGPIGKDSSDLEGHLVVEDAAGELIAEGHSSLEDSHNVSFWSDDYALPSGVPERTRFIQQLVDDALGHLQHPHTKE